MDKKDIDITKEAVSRRQSDSSSGEDLPPYAPPSYEQASYSKAIARSPVPNLIPGATKVLTVYSQGLTQCGVGNPSKELEVPVFEGTDTSTEPLYISTRAKRSSGNAILRHRQRGDIYATNYKFGPFRDPDIRHASSSALGSDVKRPGEQADEGEIAVDVKLHKITNKIDWTVVESGRTFMWRYGKTELSEGKKRVMVLEATTGKSSRPLAVLVRTNETRTPGTSRWDGGNGGQLVIDAEAGSFLDEGLIVAGCMMMLKYELDRTRGAQVAAIS